MAAIDKSNEIEKPEEPANVGEKVAVTNPIEIPEPVIYYSDQPGAGPDDVPSDEEEEEEKKKKKAVKGAPENKAMSQKSEQTK